MDPNAVARISNPFQGVVVSLTPNSVSVKPVKEEGSKSASRTVCFTVRTDAKVLRDGKTCELKDLQKGDPVSVSFNAKPGSSLRRVTEIAAGKTATESSGSTP